jgi:signal transduction histidine kinase/Flp pilus assembly protein TadD
MLVSLALCLDAATPDSLHAKLHTTHTQTLLKTYIELASYYDELNTDSLRYYANRVLDHPHLSDYPLYTAQAHYLIGNTLFNERNFEAARAKYNEALRIARIIDDPRMIGQSLSRLALMLAYEQKYHQAIELFDQSSEQYRLVNHAQGLTSNSCNVGLCYNFMGEYHNAINVLQYAIDNIQTNGDKEILINLYSTLGAIYTYLGDLNKSIDYSYLSLQISLEAGDSLATARQYNNIGNLLTRVKRYEEAETHYFRALEVFAAKPDQLQFRRGFGSALNNISLVYMYKNEYQKALEYALRCYDHKLLMPMEERDLSSSYNNLGLIYLHLKNYPEAEKYLLKSLFDESSRDGKWGKSNTNMNLAKLYRETGQFEKAKLHLDDALHTAQEIESIELIRDCYNELRQHYTALSQYDLALDAAVKELAYTDSLQQKEGIEALQTKHLLHETQLKKEQIELMKLRSQTQNETLISEKRMTTLLLLITVILTLLGILLILLLLQHSHHQRKQQHIHQQISEKQHNLQHKKQELTTMLAELRDLNEQKNRFLTIVANDLRQSFDALRSGSRMLSANGNNISPTEAHEQAQTLRISSNHLYRLLENLLKWSRSQIGNQHIEASTFNLQDVVDSILIIMQENARVNHITIHNELHFPCPVYADATMISSVVMNVMANAIRFTQPQGTITLHALVHPDQAILIIEDTGLGIPESDLVEFNAGISLESAPITDTKQAMSIGMVLSREFVESNGGTFTMESSYGEGSKVTITLPRANPNSDG